MTFESVEFDQNWFMEEADRWERVAAGYKNASKTTISTVEFKGDELICYPTTQADLRPATGAPRRPVSIPAIPSGGVSALWIDESIPAAFNDMRDHVLKLLQQATEESEEAGDLVLATLRRYREGEAFAEDMADSIMDDLPDSSLWTTPQQPGKPPLWETPFSAQKER